MTLSGRPWDYGIKWKTQLVEADETFLALDVGFVTEKIVRAVTEGAEEDLIESYIRAAMELYEKDTGDSLRPQTLRLILNNFPSDGLIELQSPPVRSVTSISYYDSSNESQDYGGSPPTWIFSDGGRYGRPTVQIGVGESWPGVALRDDAVTVEYEAGYETPAAVPHVIKTGLGLVVAEIYKNPDLSNDLGQMRNLLTLERFWTKRF